MTSEEKAYAHIAKSVYKDIIGYTHAVLRERDQLRAEVEALKQDWSRFHHLMKKHGLHPGRTDDDLIDILDRDMDAAKVGLHHIRDNNVQLRKELAELRKAEPVGYVYSQDGRKEGCIQDSSVPNGTPLFAGPNDGLRKAAQQALEALEDTITVPCYFGHPKQEAAAEALREALNTTSTPPTSPAK